MKIVIVGGVAGRDEAKLGQQKDNDGQLENDTHQQGECGEGGDV